MWVGSSALNLSSPLSTCVALKWRYQLCLVFFLCKEAVPVCLEKAAFPSWKRSYGPIPFTSFIHLPHITSDEETTEVESRCWLCRHSFRAGPTTPTPPSHWAAACSPCLVGTPVSRHTHSVPPVLALRYRALLNDKNSVTGATSHITWEPEFLCSFMLLVF